MPSVPRPARDSVLTLRVDLSADRRHALERAIVGASAGECVIVINITHTITITTIVVVIIFV